MTSQIEQQESGLQGHLPECWYYDQAKTPAVAVNDGWPCICDLLRACEQRAKTGAYNEGYVDGSKDAREGAFREAREAVVALRSGSDGVDIGFRRALAAIDALREEQK